MTLAKIKMDIISNCYYIRNYNVIFACYGVFMKILRNLAILLLVIGGLNWGLVGAFDFDLVATLFGKHSFLTRLIYILVGLAAIYKIALWAGFRPEALMKKKK